MKVLKAPQNNTPEQHPGNTADDYQRAE